MTGPRDIQSLFSARADSGDLLQAGKLEDGIGLCLSGGGYRAMLYHVGALRRLNELGLLSRLVEIASVSGGSITAGVLACAWDRLAFDERGCAPNFETEVAQPIIRMAGIGIDVRAVLTGLLPGRSAADGIAAAYDRHLFHGAGLQDLPDSPRFTFMATNLQTASGWRFAKCYAADFRVGRIVQPRFPLARVVAASSAFPPFLSPARFDFDGHAVEATTGADLHRTPFTDGAVLTDGGVYDNLGLERVWKRCRTILVSNAGKTMPDIGSPTGRWIGQAYRTLSIVQQQAENSRRRLLFGAANAGQRRVAYWSIDTPISAYQCPQATYVEDAEVAFAATIRTRLNPFTAQEIELLLRVGYSGADASLRARNLVADGETSRWAGLPPAVE
jgi:NTE family protein